MILRIVTDLGTRGHPHLSCRWDLLQDGLDQCGLALTVGTEDAYLIPFLDIDVHMLQDRLPIITDGKVLGYEHVLTGLVGRLYPDGDLLHLLRLLLLVHLVDHLLTSLVDGKEGVVYVHLPGNVLLMPFLGHVMLIFLAHALQVQHLLHYEIGIVALVFP